MRKLKFLLMVCLALLLGVGAQAQTSGGVNGHELNGNYAFSFSGIRGNGSVESAYAAVGRFTADGAGNLTNGEIDTNGVGVGTTFTAQPFTGTYSIGTDHRGVMTFTGSGGSLKFAFAMLASGNAHLIEFDASGGSGTIGSGTVEKADSSAYSTARIAGDYAFGAAGFDNVKNRAAIEARFTSNGTGTLSNAAGDVNAYGTDYPMTFSAANYTVSNPATGRGTMHFTFTFGGTPGSLNFVAYVVNAGKFFAMESDAVTTATPLFNGAAVQQQTPTGGFTNASLDGNMVIALTGLSACGSGSEVPKAVVGLLTSNGAGALSLTYDENYCRAPNSVTAAAGTYSVAANGRAAIAIGGYRLVAYLVKANQVFLFVSDANVLFGHGEPQTAVSFGNAAVKGSYAGFATNPADFQVAVFSNVFAADGATPTGNMSGAEDFGAPSGPVTGEPFKATYAVSASPTNGRGTMTVSSGTGGNGLVYAISASKFVGISLNDPNPAILEFELAPGSSTAAVSLASLAVNPASVVGGNSSTGTVTLSGPAPAGGAQVALSSSNTTAARTPASVTVAAGASSATFTVSTSAVSASTAVTISATYAGVSKTASLTVQPATPPAVTLNSLALNPTSVVGGNSSTGTVTLSGPAPAGGAQVALSSSNTTVARTPASVTIAAGASSATFTVSTSVVSASTTANISATRGGISKTASLTVKPVPPPSPTPTSLTLSPASVVGGNGSTGTVTLSGPAPAGGAQIALSSSNTSVARVPASVTVAAGATTATFTASTSVVTASTAVTLSAAYGGVTRSASLTVQPVPAPAPTLSSLTLSPTSVVGGMQASRGTVTLSATAPAGGAQITLSSSSGAASVPASVFIPAGASSATFTVNTSAVLISTSATISARYNGTTRTATLGVLL